MKIGLYTKTVLTVIAVCLIALLLREANIVPFVYASDVVDVRIVGIDESGSLRWEAIPVEVKGGSVEIDGSVHVYQ